MADTMTAEQETIAALGVEIERLRDQGREQDTEVMELKRRINDLELTGTRTEIAALYTMKDRAEAAEAERDTARLKVADAYQVIGHLLDATGWFETDEGQRALDYFADCDGPVDEGFSPWPREKLDNPDA